MTHRHRARCGGLGLCLPSTGGRAAVAWLSWLVVLTGCGRGEAVESHDAALREPRLDVAIAPRLGDSTFLGARTVAEFPRAMGFVAADAYASRLVFFDVGGQVLSTLGREGDGPGEFDRVSGLVRIGAGLVAWDFFKMRLTVLTPSGAVVRTAPTPFIGGSVSPFLANGVMLLAFDRSLHLSLAWVDDVLDSSELRWRELDISALLGPGPDVDGRPPPVVASGRSGRVYAGWGHGGYVVHVTDTTGAEILRLERDIPAPPRDAQTIADIESRRGRMGRITGSGTRGDPIHPSDPHFLSFHEDDCGRLWVQTFRGGRKLTIADVFSPNGSFVGEVAFPLQGVIHDVASNKAYLVVPDDSGIPGIAVFDLREMDCS